jgi:hypothetical protein
MRVEEAMWEEWMLPKCGWQLVDDRVGSSWIELDRVVVPDERR